MSRLDYYHCRDCDIKEATGQTDAIADMFYEQHMITGHQVEHIRKYLSGRREGEVDILLLPRRG